MAGKLPFPNRQGKIWHCPAASMTDAELQNVAGGGGEGFFSYTMNIDLKKAPADNPSDLGVSSGPIYDYPSMPKVISLQKPSAIVLLTDAIFSSSEGFAAANNTYSVNPAARWRAFPARHDKAGGILNFVDGHAAYFKRSKINNEQPDKNEPLLPDVIWNPPYRVVHP